MGLKGVLAVVSLMVGWVTSDMYPHSSYLREPTIDKCVAIVHGLKQEIPHFQEHRVLACYRKIAEEGTYRITLSHHDKSVRRCLLTARRNPGKRHYVILRHVNGRLDCSTLFDKAMLDEAQSDL